MKILLVDASRTMREIEKKVLEALGPAEYIDANDGLEALSIIEKSSSEPFTVILVEAKLENMDGITLVTRIREKDKHTPLIMVTTEADKSRVIEAIKAGVNNYIVKPFTPETFLEKVRRTLAKTEMASSSSRD